MSTAAVFTLESATRPVARKLAGLSAPPWLRLLSLLLVDWAALVSASFLTAVCLRLPHAALWSPAGLAHFSVPLALLCAIGLYSTRALHPALELRKVCCAVALATLVLAVPPSRAAAPHAPVAVVLGFLLQSAGLALGRLLLRAAMIRLGFWLTPTVIVGSGPVAQSLAALLAKHKHIGLKPVAVLDTPAPAPDRCGGRLAVDHRANAAQLKRRHRLSHVILAEPDLAVAELETMRAQYAKEFAQVVLVPSHASVGSLSVQTLDLGGFLGLETPRLEWPWTARAAKRLLDVGLASAALVGALPLLAVLYLAVRLSSPGPVFYGQRRLGRAGRPFQVWKFRSMVADADAVLAEYLARDPALRREWELTQKLPNDPRVSGIGQFLRKTSLDELPQLWNVIRGDMSLVGPRPIVEAEVARYAECYEYYQLVRPGVTGMWQVSGRSTTSYAERVRYDEYFVKNWSIWLDMYILFRTVKTVLLREGAC